MSQSLIKRDTPAGFPPPAPANAPGRALGPVRPAEPVLPPLVRPRPPTRGATWIGMLGLGLFLGGFGYWAATAPLAEAAIAPGLIKVEGSRRTIQHLEGGIVREIMVRDGDRVTAGQLLMRLDDTQSGANTLSLQSMRMALLAQDARLRAEHERAVEIAYPAELTDAARADPRAAEAMAGQDVLFRARMANLASQIGIYESRIAQARQSIASGQAQIVSLDRQLALIRDEMAGVAELLRLGLERRPRLLALQRTEAAIVGNRSDTAAQVAKAEAQIAEAEAQIRQVEDQRLQEVSAERREVRARLIETEEKLRAALDVTARRDIIAPEDGTVLNLRVFTIGAVVRPGDPVMDLTPAQDRLIAEVNVQPHDIDIVHIGLPAEARLPAFKQRLVPEIAGTVSFVASDATIDERTRQSFYRVQIRLSESELAALPAQAQLVPGMPVEVHIRAGERTFLQYLIQPLRESFSRAFKEQ